MPFGRQASTTEAEPGPAQPTTRPLSSGAASERRGLLGRAVGRDPRRGPGAPGEDISPVTNHVAVSPCRRGSARSLAAGLAVPPRPQSSCCPPAPATASPAGQRSNMAAILSSSFSRIFKIWAASDHRDRPRVPDPASTGPARRPPAPFTKPSPHTTSRRRLRRDAHVRGSSHAWQRHRRPITQVSARRARAPTPTPTPGQHTPFIRRSPSVRPGESGALGPVRPRMARSTQ